MQEENHADVIVFEHLEMHERYPERKNKTASVEKTGYPETL